MKIKDIFIDKEIEELSLVQHTNLLDLKVFPSYGKVYKNVFVKQRGEHLKSFIDDTRFINLNFVVAAYENLKQDVKKAMVSGQIERTSLFNVANFEIRKAYVSPYSYHQSLLRVMVDKFIESNKKITNCLDFTEQFHKYVLSNNNNFTIYSMMESFDIDIFSTGLGIAYLPDDTDYFEYYKDSSYPYFNNLCKKHKFMILKDKPSILVYKVPPSYEYEHYEDINDTYLQFLNAFYSSIWNAYKEIYGTTIEWTDESFQIDLSSFFDFMIDVRLKEKEIENTSQIQG